MFGRQLSLSGSIFQSENGSDPALPLSHTPPVPRLPGGLRHQVSSSDVAERSQQNPSSNTPADYALSVIFHRFVTASEAMIDTFLGQSLDEEPYLPSALGNGVNATFDGLLESLGRIAQRHTNAVIDCVRRWKDSQEDPLPVSAVRKHL